MCNIFIFMSLFACYLGNSNVKIQRRFDNRIMGGVDTDISDHPYQVSIEYLGWHVCGGAIMNKYWVITSGHCIVGRNRELLRTRAGTSTKQSGGTLHYTYLKFEHPQFDKLKTNYDIGVIKVKKPFVYSNNVKPIPLAKVEPSPGTPVVVTGWGFIDAESGLFSLQLQKVEINIISRDECAQRYVGINVVTKDMICAGVPDGGKNSCSGDSGGPLVAEGNLVGVVSWGLSCGNLRFPGVYANVAVLKKWVHSVIRHKEQLVDLYSNMKIVF